MQSAVPMGLRILTSDPTDKSVGYFHAVPTGQSVHLQIFGNAPLPPHLMHYGVPLARVRRWFQICRTVKRIGKLFFGWVVSQD
ncbi:MAG: hypothetical protein HW390_929 [Candidatus Brocadiaceae bacterium]|nr:hypothetical protein [Candidatus Brocadiaceae bacterium]